MDAFLNFLDLHHAIIIAVLFGLQGFALIMQGIYLIQFGRLLKKPKKYLHSKQILRTW